MIDLTKKEIKGLNRLRKLKEEVHSISMQEDLSVSIDVEIEVSLDFSEVKGYVAWDFGGDDDDAVDVGGSIEEVIAQLENFIYQLKDKDKFHKLKNKVVEEFSSKGYSVDVSIVPEK